MNILSLRLWIWTCWSWFWYIWTDVVSKPDNQTLKGHWSFITLIVYRQVEWCLESPLRLDWEQMALTIGIRIGLMLLVLSWAHLWDQTPAPLDIW